MVVCSIIVWGIQLMIKSVLNSVPRDLIIDVLEVLWPVSVLNKENKETTGMDSFFQAKLLAELA